MDFSEVVATNVWKLFPFRSGNRVWFFILLKAYIFCNVLGFCLACILNATEGDMWLHSSRNGRNRAAEDVRADMYEDAAGNTALDECFWYVFTTMHGCGFGEFMARGVTGRFIAMFCCSIGYWFTIFMMSIIMLSQLPGEKAPTLCGVISRMATALWPSYSVFLAIILAVGSVVGPYISKDPEGANKWPTGMYWAWTTGHRSPFGDIYPDTVFGRAVTIPIACMGVLYLPYALACIAVRCPNAEQHRELIGKLRENPEDALGRGYNQPTQAAGNGSLQEFVMQDGYIRDETDDSDFDEDGHRNRSCITCCVLIAFTLLAMVFASGGSPAAIPQIIIHTMELDLPPGIRSSADPVPPVVWTFWMHEYPLEGAGLEIFNSLAVTLDVDVQLITPDTLEQYNVTEAPFHKALKYLAPNHALDYLHAYFMHHHGGGITEIKKRKDNSTWTGAFDFVGGNETRWFLGQAGAPGPISCDESNIKDDANNAWCKELQFSAGGTYADTTKGMSSFDHSAGPCCKEVLNYYNGTDVWPRHDTYIMRKDTKFTAEWLKLVHEHLDAKLPVLQMHAPPTEPCCMNRQENYPLRWNELQGEIWSVLLMKYKKHIKFDAKLV